MITVAIILVTPGKYYVMITSGSYRHFGERGYFERNRKCPELRINLSRRIILTVNMPVVLYFQAYLLIFTKTNNNLNLCLKQGFTRDETVYIFNSFNSLINHCSKHLVKQNIIHCKYSDKLVERVEWILMNHTPTNPFNYVQWKPSLITKRTDLARHSFQVSPITIQNDSELLVWRTFDIEGREIYLLRQSSQIQ